MVISNKSSGRITVRQWFSKMPDNCRRTTMKIVDVQQECILDGIMDTLV